MEIEIFTLCDFAQDNSSKLTVVGTFDSIQSRQFPYAFVGMLPSIEHSIPRNKNAIDKKTAE